MSAFAVLTSRKTFDDYQLSINVGAGSGKIKYDPAPLAANYSAPYDVTSKIP